MQSIACGQKGEKGKKQAKSQAKICIEIAQFNFCTVQHLTRFRVQEWLFAYSTTTSIMELKSHIPFNQQLSANPVEYWHGFCVGNYMPKTHNKTCGVDDLLINYFLMFKLGT